MPALLDDWWIAAEAIVGRNLVFQCKLLSEQQFSAAVAFAAASAEEEEVVHTSGSLLPICGN
jgi:hypothetical protein